MTSAESVVRLCPKCGIEYDHSTKFCTKDGCQLIERKTTPDTCSSCGKSLQSGQIFCSHCGTKVLAVPTRQSFPQTDVPTGITVHDVLNSLKTLWVNFADWLSRLVVSNPNNLRSERLPAGQTKFALRIGETLIKEGYASYLKSTLNVLQGNGYLTSKRFVYCKKSTFLFYFLLGPLLGYLIKGKQVIFEIPLARFSAISLQKQGLGKKIVLETKDGQQYGLGFLNQDAWLKAIGETVINFVPGTTVKQDSERVNFISGSTRQ